MEIIQQTELQRSLGHETKAAQRDTSRLVRLDALRATAALVVLVYHILFELKGNYGRDYVPVYFDLGGFGVNLFFLISGFIIFRSLQNTGLKKFWIRRVFRLYPAYWVSIALGLLFSSEVIRGAVNLPRVLSNMTMLNMFFGYEGLIVVYWTLSVELLFYMLVTLLVLRGWTKAIGGITIGILVLAGLVEGLYPLIMQLQDPQVVHDSPFWIASNLATILTGALVAQKQEWLPRSLRLIAGLTLLVALGTALAGFPGAMIGRISAYLVFLVLMPLSWRPPGWLLWLGRNSYSLYLFHICVLRVFSPASPLLAVPIWIVGSLVLAELGYRLIEQPMIGFARRITAERKREHASRQAALDERSG